MKRKLLLIMPNFFDYPQAICEELENMGYEVDCFDDRPSTNGMVKAIIRVNKNLIGQYIKRYFEKVMKTVRAKKYDVVFLISGQSLSFSEGMIQQIKDEQPQVLVMIKLLVLHKKQEQKYISTSFTIMRSSICMQLKLQT